MPVVFDYVCDECGTSIKNYLKMSRDDPDPECPGCSAISQRLPPVVNIGTNKGRAVDIAQREAEDHGFTDMRDNLREGDIAAPRLAPHLQKVVDGFWGSAATPALAGKGPADMLAIARNAAAQSKAEGSNPLALTQQKMRLHGGDGKPKIRVDANGRSY